MLFSSTSWKNKVTNPTFRLHSSFSENKIKHNTFFHALIFCQFKGYLPCEVVFCNDIALDMSLMNLFIWKKKSFSRYLDFCVFVNLHISKSVRHHRHCHIMEVTLMLFSFKLYVPSKWNLVRYVLVYCMTNISNIFLAQW